MNHPTSGSKIYRLAYISRASEPLTENELKNIETVSASNNRQQNIYGVLVTDKERIIQILEGDRHKVEALLRKISKDPRHHSLKVFAEDMVEHESFKQWFMGVIDMGRRPEQMQKIFHSMCDTFENTPIPLSLNEDRIEFFRELATWS